MPVKQGYIPKTSAANLARQAKYDRRIAEERKAAAAMQTAIFLQVVKECPGMGFELTDTEGGVVVQLSSMNPGAALQMVRIANEHDLTADELNDLVILELLDRGRKRKLLPASATILEKRRAGHA